MTATAAGTIPAVGGRGDKTAPILRFLDSHAAVADQGAGKIILVIPGGGFFPDEIDELRRHEKVAGVVTLSRQGREIPPQEEADAILSTPGSLPRVALILMPVHEVGRQSALQLRRRGAQSMIFWDGLQWCRESILRFILSGVPAWLANPIDGRRLRGQLRLAWPLFKLHQILMASRTARLIVRRMAESLELNTFAQVGKLLRDCPPRADSVSGRIILVNNSLTAGGAERQLVNTAIGLKAAGFDDISVLHLGKKQDDAGLSPDFHARRLIGHGVSIDVVVAQERTLNPDVHISGHNARIHEALRSLPLDVRAHIINHYLKFCESRPEVVHLWLDFTSVTAGIAAGLAGVPVILLSGRNLAPFNFELWQPWMKAGYATLLKLPNVRLLVNSKAGALSYEKWLGLPPGAVAVLYNGFDPAFVEESMGNDLKDVRHSIGLPAQEGEVIVGGVFRFWPEKDPGLWIASAAEIARQLPDVRFVLVGDGILREEMQKRVAELGLENRFVWTGVRQDVGAIMRLFDVFLLTSHAEGLPNVVLEAQSLGVPVVATESGGTAEALSDGETGVIIRRRNAAVIAEQIVSLLQDANRRRSMAEAGPAWIEKRFGLQRMIEETVRHYFAVGADGKTNGVPELEAPEA